MHSENQTEEGYQHPGNKLASLEVTVFQNYDILTKLIKRVKFRTNSTAKNSQLNSQTIGDTQQIIFKHHAAGLVDQDCDIQSLREQEECCS